MREMKYVMVESEEYGEQLFIFPTNIDHDKFAEVLHDIGSYEESAYREPVGAGFTNLKECYGESGTLGIGNRKKDTRALRGEL